MRRSFYHLTHDDREVILEGIVSCTPLVDIARSIGKDPTSLSREVRMHRVAATRSTTRWTNNCVHAKGCARQKLCSDTCRKPACVHCLTRRCFDVCPDFEEDICCRTTRWPHVCNGCQKHSYCGYERYYYRPSVAHFEADNIKRQSRRVITLGKEELLALDTLVTPLLRINKQSPEAIVDNNPEEISISASTLRRYIDKGELAAIRLDLLSAPSRKVYLSIENWSTNRSKNGPLIGHVAAAFL